MRTVNSFVGSPIERIEDPRFLRGRGEYVDDLTRAGLLHAAVLRSAVAHGRIRAIDASAALARPGVHAVITAAEIGLPVPIIPMRLQPFPAFQRFRQPVIAHDKVRYVGEPLAVVVADSAALAEDALDAIAVEIESLPALVEREESGKDEVLLFEENGTNVAAKFTASLGDCEAAFRDAPYVRRERFKTQRHTALPMEARGLLAEWDQKSERLTVSGAAKIPFFNRRALAAMMGLEESAVDLMENDVGGGFGARGEFYPEDFLIPFAARRLGRPIQWTEDRREHLTAINHARQMECDVELACELDGRVLGLRGDIFVDVGAYLRTNGLTPPRNVAQFFSGPYRIPSIHLDCFSLVTNKTPAGTYRGPGRFEGAFFCERLFDMAAQDLGIDRVAFRRRNLITEAEMPYAFARVTPTDAYGETKCDSGDYRITLDRCLEEFDWAGKSHLQGQLIDGRHHGTAIACFVEGGAAGPSESARLVLGKDGSVAVQMGSSSIGQGLETVMAQIAADALEIPMERISGVSHGSTTLVREGFGAFHSRSVVMGGSALLLASAAFLQAIRDAAAARLDCAPEAIQIADGRATAPGGGTVTWAELGAAGLFAEEKFSSSHNTYAYGAAAAHVAVDPRTGHVELLDLVVVEDVGRVINPLTLHGQVIGAAVQGLGSTFMEHLVYDKEGQLLTGSLADYLIPTANDYPNIRAVSMGLKPSPNNPLGAKGAGEGGLIPVGGVIANAVASALSSYGVQPRELPLTPQSIWHLIEEARRSSPAAA